MPGQYGRPGAYGVDDALEVAQCGQHGDHPLAFQVQPRRGSGDHVRGARGEVVQIHSVVHDGPGSGRRLAWTVPVLERGQRRLGDEDRGLAPGSHLHGQPLAGGRPPVQGAVHVVEGADRRDPGETGGRQRLGHGHLQVCVHDVDSAALDQLRQADERRNVDGARSAEILRNQTRLLEQRSEGGVLIGVAVQAEHPHLQADVGGHSPQLGDQRLGATQPEGVQHRQNAHKGIPSGRSHASVATLRLASSGRPRQMDTVRGEGIASDIVAKR